MNNPPQMKRGISLRGKLVLSYLGVALGAIILMVIVVTIAVQTYFYKSQIDLLQASAENAAQTIPQYYQQNNNSWLNLTVPLADVRDYSLIMDADGHIYTPVSPPLPENLADNADIKQALQDALHGNEKQGNFQITIDDGSSPFSGIYASAPIRLNNQTIGAIVLVQANHYQRGFPGSDFRGFSPDGFLSNVNMVILIAGIGVAGIVIIFSLFMTRHLTRPLISLTQAAEGVKAGNYAQRVEQPKSQDELGRLAFTFNAMADKIASDVHALRVQEQLRRDLIANIAHDLVTPLTAIQGYSEAIADDVISNPLERQETAQLIGREVQRLRRLVSDMQNMTALEAGRVQLELAPLDMHDLVTETLAVIAPECEQTEIELQNAIDPATPPALADSDRITQVLLNLLDNARRHTPAGGRITIGARPEGHALVVWVKDTGVGINPQDLPYIFERFYRVDRARNAASGGSGLGLAIIKAVIAGHGGTTWVQSTLGQGTTIFFTLPLASVLPSAAQTNARRQAEKPAFK
jgi:two-component system, OmpR family, sensor histidine kinase BaeS